jgi:hypothetical protein
MRRAILAFTLVCLAAAAASADTLYLRDGRVVRGTVIGFIGGRFAVRVNTPATPVTTPRPGEEPGEIQFFRPREIERVELDGRSLDEARFDTRTVEVALGPNWVDTGVDLRRGERISVNASGTIVAGRTRITPGGLSTTDPTAPLPGAAEGVLVGAIGDDPSAPVVEIGLAREFQADRDGRLYLTPNRGTYTDARGSFVARVRRERDFSRRRQTAAGDRAAEDEDDDLFGTTARAEPARTRPRARQAPGNPSDTPRDPFGTPAEDRDRGRGPREVSVEVQGTSQGTDTGLDLRAGDRVTVEATGMIVAGRRVGSVSANGRQGGTSSIIGNPRYPYPQAGAGALIGAVRLTDGTQTQPFFVGTQLNFTAQADGRLFLLVNDDNYSDNSGSFTVRIRVN